MLVNMLEKVISMLANVSYNVLFIAVISMIVIGILVIAGGAIWGIFKARKNNSPERIKIILISILAIVVAAVSWISNFGWIRFIITMMLLPFIHAIILFVTNLFVSAYADKSNKVKIFNLLVIATYLLSYIFLPDRGDSGEMYFFFGLVQNDLFSNIALCISCMIMEVHFVSFVLQIVFAVFAKKNITKSNCS